MRRRIALGACLAFLATALTSAPATAAGTLTVDPPSGAHGQVLTAHGSGIPAGQLVTLRWDGVILPETGTSADDGTFEIGFAIPASAAVGGHELRACIRNDCSVATPFTVAVVLAAPSSNPTDAPTPQPSAPASAAPSSPPESTTPSAPATSSTPDASASASPAASASGVIAAPTAEPTLVPAGPTDPDTLGRLKQAWPWLLIAGGGLGLALLALYVVLTRNDTRVLMSRTGPPLEGHGSEKWLKDRTVQLGPDEPAGDLTAGTAEPTAEATKDVKVKGKKIGEN